MSKSRDDSKVTVGGTETTKSQKKPRRRSQRSSTRRKRTGGDGNQLAVIDAVADLRFPDDFAEYVARAEGGGSTYGVLRRHAFAQSSLRIRRPTTDGGDTPAAAVSRQRRSRSLVPPPRRRSGDQTGSTDTSLPNHKSLLQALCAQTQQQQQQRTKHAGTLQV